MIANGSHHARYMRRALALARRGGLAVKPNPLVGAILVQNNKIIGCGWHEYFGGPHAEINAISDAGGKAQGSTLYVTLEPCNHEGHTGPCTEAILQAGIREVYFSTSDPNSAVRGNGANFLSQHSVFVHGGILHHLASELNASWFHWLATGEPLVTGAIVRGLNGGIAEVPGEDALTAELSLSQEVFLTDDGLIFNGRKSSLGYTTPEETLRRLGRDKFQSLVLFTKSEMRKFAELRLLKRLFVIHEEGFLRDTWDLPFSHSELLAVRKCGKKGVSLYQLS